MVTATKQYPLAEVNYGAEEIDAVTMTLASGQTTCGPKVREFEQTFANYVASDHAVMVNSGSSADLLLALHLGPPDQTRNEIILPAVTWPTQVWSCLMAGYKVVLADVNPETLQMDERDALSKITRHTRAVFLTHLLGLVGEIDRILALPRQGDLSISIIEDCCESLGTRWRDKHVGTLGDAGAFSFFFSHLISTMEGGMVVCNNESAERDYRLLRSHGWEPKKNYRFWFPTWGLNVRPMEVQAAFGSVQMQRIEQFRDGRVRNVARLAARTWNRYPQSLSGPKISKHCTPSWHGFPIMVSKDAKFTRDLMCAYLDEHGVETRPIVAGNLARQPAVKAHIEHITTGPLPGADTIHDQGFYIGTPSHDEEEGTNYVGDVVDDFMTHFG